MPYVVGGGGGVPGIDVHYKVEMEIIRQRLNDLGDQWKHELVTVNRKAGTVVNDRRKKMVPKITGHFAAAGYVVGQATDAYVGLRNTGWGSNDYIGVQEFGGSIPRHKGKARLQTYTYFKPHGGPSGDGYFLYPALQYMRPQITEIYQRELAILAQKYMP
jgi:hypothetical protein